MPSGGLSSGDAFLTRAARKYFNELFQNPTVSSGEVDPALNWTPSFHFKVHDHLAILVEVSESPYPLILNIRRTDIIKVQMPIAVYCACPEEAYLAQQSDAKRLMNDGYGLLTVAADGSAQRRSGCIPLLQQITKEEFLADIKGLPGKFRTRLAESFERYNANAPSGLVDITEVMEGLVLKAGRDAVTQTWIDKKDAKPGAPAKTLQAMQAAPQFQNVSAAIGAAQGYISMYRNISHHFPKDRKQAAKKYRDCRHGFLEGLKKIVFFRDALRGLGLSGGL